ncbi:MAG TPA: hypothetical protein VNN55_08740 [bacterium]|nr:hypothetical protein [bacterium]
MTSTTATTAAFSVEVAHFSDIDRPGVWVDQNDGKLYRIFPGSLQPGHSPLIDVPTARNLILVDADPAALYEKVRMVCSNHNIRVQPYEP